MTGLEWGTHPHLRLDDGTTLAFDRLLFTGPSPAWARLLPPAEALDAYREQLLSMDYLGAVCLVFASPQDLTSQHWLNIQDPDAPFLVLVNHTRLVGCALYGGQHLYYLGCYCPVDNPRFQADDSALVQSWLAYLPGSIPPLIPGPSPSTMCFALPTPSMWSPVTISALPPACAPPAGSVSGKLLPDLPGRSGHQLRPAGRAKGGHPHDRGQPCQPVTHPAGRSGSGWV